MTDQEMIQTLTEALKDADDEAEAWYQKGKQRHLELHSLRGTLLAEKSNSYWNGVIAGSLLGCAGMLLGGLVLYLC